MSNQSCDNLDQIEIDERTFCYQPAPHLYEGDDWHTAYQRKIVSWFEGQEPECTVIPQYPLLSRSLYRDGYHADELLFEMGAYWEGAIYFLKQILERTDLFHAVNEIYVTPIERLASTREKLFAAIWNSDDQLEWLKAFLLREHAKEHWDIDIYDASPLAVRRLADSSDHPDQLQWLADFLARTAREGRQFPNPYYGGSNPLHLTTWETF